MHPGVSDTYCSFLLLQNVLNYHLSFVPLCQFFIALIEIHGHIHVMCCQQIHSTLIPLQFIFYPHYLCYLQSSFVLFKFLNPTIHLVIFMGKRIGLSCNIRKLSGSTILKKTDSHSISSNLYPKVPHLGLEVPPPHAMVLSGFILCRYYYNCCQFICAFVLLCAENPISLEPFTIISSDKDSAFILDDP